MNCEKLHNKLHTTVMKVKYVFTILLIVLLTNMSLMLHANDDEVWRVYVTSFVSQDEALNTVATEVSNDFQIVLNNCNKRFRVLDREKYISWIEEASSDSIDENRQLLQIQDLDYLVFGEVLFNQLKQKYSIEYAFEEVNTGKILFIDNLIFDDIEAIQNRETRYKLIANRLTKEFDLCRKEERIVKSKMTDVKASIKHELVDDDKDGIPNLIDVERYSPKGALVNSRGRAYTEEELKLKEKSTNNKKTEAEKKQDEMEALLIQMMPDMPSISFLQYSNRVEEEAFTQLHQVAQVMEMYPAIRVIVKGNTTEASEIIAYQRAYNTVTYLMKHYGIPQKRLILAYGKSEEDTAHSVLFDVTLKENLVDMEEPAW